MCMGKVLYLWCIFSLFILLTEDGLAQGSKVSGTVLDETGLPLPGATVKVKNRTWGVVTDINGKFNLDNIPETDWLIVSFVGRKTVEVAAGGNLKIVLYPQNKELGEALVQVAYGSAKRNAITGAVSSTRSDEIVRRPVTSVVSALEGAVVGVQVNGTYGQPGDDPVIRIRGIGSVNGNNEPLYVVDGIPFDRFPFSGALAELNPLDVESISVLKDASAAALYGNRAANGVILITTRKAKNQRLGMEVSVRQGIYSRGMKEYECVGTDDFMEVMWKSYRNALLTSKPAQYPTVEAANAETNASLVKSFLKYNIYNLPADQLFDSQGHLAEGAAVRDAIREDLDWFGPLERKGYRQEYNLSGGAMLDKCDYRFSLGYLKEDGYLRNAGFDRLTARLQLNLLAKDWLKYGFTLSGNYQNQNITDGMGNTFVNVFNIARYVAPIYPLHLHDLETGDYILNEMGEKQYDDGVAGERPQYPKRNIVWENEINCNKQTRMGITGQAYADVKLPAGFTFTFRTSLYLGNNDRSQYFSPEIGDGIDVGWIYRYQYRFKQYVFQEQLNWMHQFGKHTAEALLAHENYYYNYDYVGLSLSDQIVGGNTSLINFTTMKGMSGYPKDYRTESYLGRLKYNYDGKYFAEFSFRRDGSSRFHPEHRWGNFGSAGLGWIVSEENCLQQVNWLDFLKLRFSYGAVGNDASADYYAWMLLYKIDVNGGLGALYKSQNISEDKNIKWETSASYDVALEATLFGRWNLTAEYFDKRSKDLLFNVTLPLSSGATSTEADKMASVLRNLGSVSNRGWELSTDVDIVRSANWKWNLGANATFLKNKILTLPAENRKNGIVIAGQNQKYMEGHSVYEWWLPVFAGVDRLTGNSLYQPNLEQYYVGEKEEGKQALPKEWLVKNGDHYYTTNTSYARKDWCGSALPDVFGSFSSQLSWKGIALSALFTYSLGGKVFDRSYATLMATGTSPRAVHRDILKSWEKAPEGMTEDALNRLDPNGIPVVNSDLSGQNNAESSRFLIDGSYLWVKNISASYSFPQAIVRKLDLQSISLSFNLENVACLTKRQGMNPQQSFTGLSEDILVAPRIFSLGLTVKL